MHLSLPPSGAVTQLPVFLSHCVRARCDAIDLALCLLMKKSSFQYGMKFSIENEIFIPGPTLAAEKQGPGLKFSIENENFKPRMKFSSENENFVRGGMVFSCVRARMNFFDLRALWVPEKGIQTAEPLEMTTTTFFPSRNKRPARTVLDGPFKLRLLCLSIQLSSLLIFQSIKS